MAVINYYSVGGELFGESTSGAMTTYMSDALGSTIGTIESGAVLNRYLYTPFGGILHKDGVGAEPRFLWNGRSGFASSRFVFADYYERFSYSSAISRWCSPVVEQPGRSPYGFAGGNPTTKVGGSAAVPSPVGPWVRALGAKHEQTGVVGIVASGTTGCLAQCVAGTCLPKEICGPGTTYDAITDCNPNTGGMYTWVCNCDCDKPCTEAHEAVHRADYGGCCSGFHDCLSSGDCWASVCKSKWADYFNDKPMTKWSECRAYHVGLECRQGLWVAYGCNSHPDSPCCAKLASGMANDIDKIAANCPGTFRQCPSWGEACF